MNDNKFLGEEFLETYIKYYQKEFPCFKFIEINKLNEFFDTLKGSKAIEMYINMDTYGSGREVYFTVDGEQITTYGIGYLIDEMNKDKKFRNYLKNINKGE